MDRLQDEAIRGQDPAMRYRCPDKARRSSSEVQWARYRPVIKQLYVDEDRTLHDVIDIMKRDFGFDAT